jgi:hypothetical protein
VGVWSHSGGRLLLSWQEQRSHWWGGGAAGAGSRGRTTPIVVTPGPLGRRALRAARRPSSDVRVHRGEETGLANERPRSLRDDGEGSALANGAATLSARRVVPSCVASPLLR